MQQSALATVADGSLQLRAMERVAPRAAKAAAV
jgi:hypothetical protein